MDNHCPIADNNRTENYTYRFEKAIYTYRFEKAIPIGFIEFL